ncbi:MAG: T9SS type A sorting domain-containing protein [Bacteroidota bacterium]
MRSFTFLFCLLFTLSGYAQLNLPVNFELTPVTYSLTDFGGNSSVIVADPTNASNTVAMTIKTATAETWAGTTVGGTTGFATAIPFAAGSTTMSVRVYSPAVGTPIRLKVEDSSNPTISVETEALTTVASTWETLIFNFSNQASGTAAINFANTYNKASIFFNFGTTGASAGAQTYYWDDMQFGGSIPPPALNLPVTFDNSLLNYGLTDFGGNNSVIEPDPTNASNMVAKTIKTATAVSWAGTTIGGTNGFATAVPFAPGATKMNVRVYSPAAGTPIRLKVEAANNPTISVETEALTTVASTWETLIFDFSNQASGTAAINFANAYNKASIFFNFGTTGASAGAQTYYWDDVKFGGTVGIGTIETSAKWLLYPNPASVDFTINISEPICNNAQINISDITGKMLRQERIQKNVSTVNTSDFKEGLYVIRIQNGNSDYFQKLVIAR